MGRSGKLAIVIIQLIIACIFLLGSIVGIILGAINAGGIDELSFSNIGAIAGDIASSATYGLVLFFSIVLFLLAAFVLLAAIYKWPPKAKKKVIMTRVVK